MSNKQWSKMSDNIQIDVGCFKVKARTLPTCMYSCISRTFLPAIFFALLIYCCLGLTRTMCPVEVMDDSINNLSNDTFHSYQDWPSKNLEVGHSNDNDDNMTNVHDSKTRIDKHDYKYIHNPESLCMIYPKQVHLLVMISSAPMNADRRDIIRSTYGNPNEWVRLLNRNSIVQVIFLLGKTNNLTLQTDIDKEYDLHGDIIQEDFVDSYSNLMMKTVMGFKWVTNNCGNAHYVIKCDDTSVIIQPKLFASVSNVPTSNWAGGLVLTGFPVVRNTDDECYVSEEFYSFPRYPSYLKSPGYVLTTDLVDAIYKIATTTPLSPSCPMEDLFIGMCLEKLNVSPKNINDFVKAMPEWWLTDFENDTSKKQMVKKFSVISNLAPQHMAMIWRLTKLFI